MPAPSPARGSAPTAPRCSRLQQDGERVLDDLVRLAALDVGDEADAAGILVERGIVEALRAPARPDRRYRRSARARPPRRARPQRCVPRGFRDCDSRSSCPRSSSPHRRMPMLLAVGRTRRPAALVRATGTKRTALIDPSAAWSPAAPWPGRVTARVRWIGGAPCAPVSHRPMRAGSPAGRIGRTTYWDSNTVLVYPAKF